MVSQITVPHSKMLLPHREHRLIAAHSGGRGSLPPLLGQLEFITTTPPVCPPPFSLVTSGIQM